MENLSENWRAENTSQLFLHRGQQYLATKTRKWHYKKWILYNLFHNHECKDAKILVYQTKYKNI